jgi:RNA polymerase primary sigma factor
MNQANNVLETNHEPELETIHQPDSDLELLIEAVDLHTIDTEENDEFLETQPDEDDAKSARWLNLVVDPN